ncbi:MAG TPA: carbohydrate ABC transporter permease [Candidatus Limnocylindria bacterium]|jgi:alpha-glucoside transport system permease protein
MPRRRRWLGQLAVNGTLAVICFIWLVPTIGLLVSSIRPAADVLNSGWWSVLPHQDYVTTKELPIPTGVTGDAPITIEGVSATFDGFRGGVTAPDGRRILWVGNRRTGRIEIQQKQWVAPFNFTLRNYQVVLSGGDKTYENTGGTLRTERGSDLGSAFMNSIAVTIPATVIPLTVAAFAAYGFAWMRFRGRMALFALLVALLVIPLQIALVPVLRDYTGLNLNGTYLGVWLAHTGFGLPLAIYLVFGFVSEIPRDLIDSAVTDGASHFAVFRRIIIPLSVPVLASFAIFQFLWVWNDYLVATTFLGGTQDVQVLTIKLVNLAGTRGQDWQLLTAGAFVSMIIPLIVFFALQRYFVRGLLAGSVKG